MAWRSVARFALISMIVAVGAALSAQSPTFGVGRAPTAD